MLEEIGFVLYRLILHGEKNAAVIKMNSMVDEKKRNRIFMDASVFCSFAQGKKRTFIPAALRRIVERGKSVCMNTSQGH